MGWCFSPQALCKINSHSRRKALACHRCHNPTLQRMVTEAHVTQFVDHTRLWYWSLLVLANESAKLNAAWNEAAHFSFATRCGCFFLPLSSHGVASDGKKNLHICFTSMSGSVNVTGEVKARCVAFPPSNRAQTRQRRLSGGRSSSGPGLGDWRIARSRQSED